MQTRMGTLRAQHTDQAGRIGAVIGAAATVLATAIAVGWFAHVAWLVRSRPGPATVTLTGALCLALVGAGAATLCWWRPAQRRASLLRTITGLALLAAAIAVASLLEDVSGWSVGIDQLLVRDHYTVM